VSDPLAATVVIVNYCGRGRLGRCLDAIANASNESSFEVIVVDNASDDGSRDEAEGRPGVRLLRNDENVGFGRACNQAARPRTAGSTRSCAPPTTIRAPVPCRP
jgi:N-acetylglucosaminyl-diphospho-decaprenol L-rhamnosyltransferase